MTVGYMKIAATAKLGTFLRLLLRWRGSVWKGVWRELLVWLFIYNWISITYRFFLRDSYYGEKFEQLVINTDMLMKHARTALIFVLGFYVSHIANRWWNVFMEIPWPDTIALSIAAFLHTRHGKEKEKEDRTIRVNIMRYIIVAYVLVFRDVCERIRLRFPTFRHLKPSLLNDEELERLEKCDDTFSFRQWLPIEWSLMLLKRCKDRKQISDVHFVYLTKEILKFRDRLQNIKSFDWINVPLVYSQVVSLSTSVYFLMCLIARQYIAIPTEEDIRWQVDYILPYFTMAEFICLVGWLKCAQVMINPFGQDDDDFEVDTLIERNLAVSMSMVDDLYDRAPPLSTMDFKHLPGILDPTKKNPMVGSAVPMKMQPNEMLMVDPNKEKWIKTGTQMVDQIYSGMEASEVPIEDGINKTTTNLPANTAEQSKSEDTSYKKLLAGSPTGKAHQNSQEEAEVLEKLKEQHVMLFPSDFFEKDLDALLDKTQANSPRTSVPSSAGVSNRLDGTKNKTPRPSGESMAEREDKTPQSYSALDSPIDRTQMSGYNTTKNTPIHSLVDMTGLLDTPKKTPESNNATAVPVPRKTPTPQKTAAPSTSKAKFDDGLIQLIEKMRAKEHHAKRRSKSSDSQWKETKTPNRHKGSTPAPAVTPKRSREKLDITAKTVYSKDPLNPSRETTQAKTTSKEPTQSKEPAN